MSIHAADTLLSTRADTHVARLTPEELCAQYADRVYAFASMVARDEIEAEDLAQAALERALRALSRFDPARGEIGSWLWVIVVNLARDAGRAAQRRHLLLQRFVTLREPGPPADDIPAGISDGRLIAAVRRLPRSQRSVIGLRYGADLPYDEIARALGVSPGAARIAGHRALASLRRTLQEGAA